VLKVVEYIHLMVILKTLKRVMFVLLENQIQELVFLSQILKMVQE